MPDHAPHSDFVADQPVGDTTLSLPRFGLGAAHFGGQRGRVPAEVARETMQAAWDGGVRYFDTAPFYGRGLSEHRLGEFLIDRNRADFILTTKVGRVFRPPGDPDWRDTTRWPGGLRFEFDFDYSGDGVLRSHEQSLLRLGLDRVDALLIHDPDRRAHGDDWQARMRDMATSGIKALEGLKRSGDIQAIGMGLNTAEALAEIPDMVPLDFVLVAMPYTLLDQSALADLDRLADRGVAVIIGAPFASGILVTGPGPGARYRYQTAEPEIQTKAGAIQKVCESHGVPLATAAMHFPLAHRGVVSIIPGCAHPDEVKANLDAYRHPIPDALWIDLKDAGLIAANAPVPDSATRAASRGV